MAAANPADTLKDEMSCPICLEYFNDPVSLDCDHNFCRACITHCWDGSPRASCPQCRKTFPRWNLKPNRQLRNIVEAVRGLRFQSVREAQTGLCEKHSEPLKLFCKDDQVPICVVCDRSKEHRDHMVIPAEEALDQFKENIQAYLKTLRKEREELLELKVRREKKNQENQTKTQIERQKIVSEFQQLQQFLEQQEQLLLTHLEKLDKEMMKIQDENITKLAVEISRLSMLISDMEGKFQKPGSEFLQDVKSTLSLSRCQKGKFQRPEEIFPELEKGLSDFSQKTVALMETVRMFKDTLLSALERKFLPPDTPLSALERKGQKSLGSLRQSEIRVTVTLDPDTAHTQLVLSADQKSVGWVDRRQNLLNNPKRFDTERCVLGREAFTWGKHCWEVEVEDGQYWAVGVARESVRRKGQVNHSPEEGIWAVKCSGDQFEALTSPATPLPLIRVPRRLRVCLDCNQGQVTFFDVGDKIPIFAFPPGSVSGEIIRPWLWVLWWGSRLRLCP